MWRKIYFVCYLLYFLNDSFWIRLWQPKALQIRTFRGSLIDRAEEDPSKIESIKQMKIFAFHSIDNNKFSRSLSQNPQISFPTRKRDYEATNLIFPQERRKFEKNSNPSRTWRKSLPN